MRKLLLLLVLVTAASPAAARVVVRTTLKPDSGVVLGQHVRVLVDVLFPGEMERPPRVTMPDTSGAQILRYESQATDAQRKVDGRDRVGQRFEFALYPRRGGRLEVPAPQVVTSIEAARKPAVSRGRPRHWRSRCLLGSIRRNLVVAASAFTLEHSWQPDPRGAFKAGDAIVRTIGTPGAGRARHGDARPRLPGTSGRARLSRAAPRPTTGSTAATSPASAPTASPMSSRAAGGGGVVPASRRSCSLGGISLPAGCGARKEAA